MSDRELLKLAARTLEPDHFAVWLTKHVQHLGRRAGSKLLGITHEAYRYRLAEAERQLDHAITLEKETAA